jgi:hypothetical protein
MERVVLTAERGRGTVLAAHGGGNVYCVVVPFVPHELAAADLRSDIIPAARFSHAAHAGAIV